MTPEDAVKLREAFPPESVGKLPKVWCRACTDANKTRRGTTCDQHKKMKCGVCRNDITEAHVDLDFVGHAVTTARLLSVDPDWSWEPVAFDADGLPAIKNGLLWIRLTVCGVTRYGVGDGDTAKVMIGDAIRNAAMRFGVALDLWSREEIPEASGADRQTGADGQTSSSAPVSETKVYDLNGRAAALVADKQPVADTRMARGLPPINKSNAEQLEQWDALLTELEARLEAPFVKEEIH